MPEPDNTVRVFISSTFKDMHAERDHLVTVVFPELRERCERLGLEFFDVDLRWGVPEKGVDGEKANSWEYCKKWIDQVEPFFVGILGQRYGYQPEPALLKDHDLRRRQVTEKRSITDMEVRYAVIEGKLKRRSYFYLRSAEAPATATDFVDPPPLLAKLNQLKTEVRACGRPARDYDCEWTGSAFTGMEKFGKKVLDDLWSGVLRDKRYVKEEVWQQVLGPDADKDARYTDESVPVPEDLAAKLVALAKPEPKEPLDKEREGMRAFAESRLRWFQGRKDELKQLADFILAPAGDNASRVAVIAAVPGQGKSALMAKLSETLQPQASGLKPAIFLISHFVGATEQSSSSYNLVKRLFDELESPRSGIAWPEPPQEEGKPKETPQLDFNSLCHRLAERLGDYAGEKRIVVLLDALNQLNDGHELGWLPYRLGPGVRVVVSCIEEAPPLGVPASAGQTSSPDRVNAELPTPAQKVLAALDARHPKPMRVPLAGLSADDVRTIVKEYLAEYCKELDPPHVDAICDGTKLPQARNPLYLLVMLAELRTLGGNDMNRIVPEKIATMAHDHPDTVKLFQWVLERLEVFGAEAVKWWCLYLALGRVGMASRELADLLKDKLKSEEAALIAQRIQRGLRRYLQRRGETLDFFHGQLRQAVMEKYGEKAKDIPLGHREAADYFLALADPDQNKIWKGTSVRPFNEIAFHLINADDINKHEWDDLCAYLTDLACLDRRIRDGQIFALVTDQRTAIAALPEFATEARQERERVEECKRYGDALVSYARECGMGRAHALTFVQKTWRWILVTLRCEREGPPARPLAPSTELSSMIRNEREDHLARAARLRTFANFTAIHASMLSTSHEDFLPIAANHAGDGPLTAAAGLLAAKSQPWINRSPRPPAPPLWPQCLHILQGHTDFVRGVSMTSDGGRAVSGSHDNTLRAWDLDSGQCLHILQGHTSWVKSVSVTPDGGRAVSGSLDKTLRIWDLNSGHCLGILEGHSGTVGGVSVTPDGRRAVSGSDDKTVRVWDVDSGQCLHILNRHTQPVNSVSVTPDGRRAVSGSDDNTVRHWNLETGKCLRTLYGHPQKVTSVSVTPDGRRAVSGSVDKTLRVWDLHTGQCLHTLQGHASSVSSVSVTADGRRAVSGSTDNTLRVWDLDSGKCRLILQGHSAEQVMSVSMTSDGRRAVSGGDDFLRVWDLESEQCLHNLEGHSGPVMSVSVTPDGRRAVSGSWDETLRLWDFDTGQCLDILQGHTQPVNSVSITADGRLAVSGSGCAWFGSCDNTLRVWNLDTGQCLHTLHGHTQQVNSVSVTPDGRRAVSGSGYVTVVGTEDNTLRVWNLGTGQCLHTLQGNAMVTSVNVTPDGRCTISGSSDKNLHLWKLDSGRCLRTYQGHADVVTSVNVTADGRRAISGSFDRCLRLWDLDSGQCLLILQGHTSSITSVSVTPDGKRAVSGSDDNTMRFWDLTVGQCLAIYHTGAAVRSVAVSAVGDRIVCGTEDGQMHFLTLRNFGTGKVEMEK